MNAEYLLQVKKLELQTLFDTIEAINANATEESLYKLYTLTVRSNLHISKLALFVKDEQDRWTCKTFFGTLYKYSDLSLDPAITLITEKKLEPPVGIPYFEEFSSIIPIRHKEIVLAYVFLSGKENQEDNGADLMQIKFLEALTNIIIVAVENKKLVRKQLKQKEYSNQLEIARNVQGFLFPNKLPQNEHLWVEASYLPHHTIGGDYYDFLDLGNNRFIIVIADVSGKGVPAALLMSNFQAGLRVLAQQNNPLDSIVKTLNKLVYDNSRGENFITAFFLICDQTNGTIEYINAGHNPPFMFVKGEMRRLETGTTILGSFKTLPFIHQEKVENLQQFLIFCFTDGFSETYNDAEIPFGEDDLGDFVAKNLSLPLPELHTRLISYLNNFKGKQQYIDDITLYSVRVNRK